ncbi:MAG: lipo-like protein [Pseudomonadota bacterium]
MFSKLRQTIADAIVGVLNRETTGYRPFTPSDKDTLLRTLRPGDVLLVEGNQKVSAGIKYLTQSTWSHAAIYVGDALADRPCDELYCDPEAENAQSADTRHRFVEMLVKPGCISVPLEKYENFNTRICRAVNLTPDDRDAVVAFAISKLGLKYDMRNIFDLARYLIPRPPVPTRFRRKMLAFGSGDPTKAICSTMIAQAFQSIRYPILPNIEDRGTVPAASSLYSRDLILHIRHHSLFTPRDFDVSPFFEIVKPTLESGFDYKRINWAPSPVESGPDGVNTP